MEVEWSEESLRDVAALDKVILRRIKRAIERLAETGAGNVKQLQGIHPTEYRLRVGDWRVRFRHDAKKISILRVRHRREAYR